MSEMNAHFLAAEAKVTRVRDELSRILAQDGEDISCYNSEALEFAIPRLVDAMVHMGQGRQLDDKIRAWGKEQGFTVQAPDMETAQAAVSMAKVRGCNEVTHTDDSSRCKDGTVRTARVWRIKEDANE